MQSRIRAFLPFIVGLLCFEARLSCGRETVLAAKTIRNVEAAMRAEIQRQEAVGLAIGIVLDGEIAYLQCYGWADREAKTPVTCDTMFRWASVSKLLTAIATMQLVEEEKLSLDDDVRQYVPEFPDHGQRITVRHLLCHQSGIVHYHNGPVIRTERDYDNPHPFANVVTALDTFKESPLVAHPGEKSSYSTHGYILLSAVVQRAGGAPFAQQVQQRIANPLGLRTLQPDYQWVDIPNRATGYRRVDDEIVRSTDTDVSWKLAGGGFISTINDMALFAAAVARGRLLQPTTWRKMGISQRTDSGQPTANGLGFAVSSQNGLLKLSHSGAQEKVRTRLVTYPERGSGVVVMCNSEYANPGRFSTLVYSALSP